MVLEVAPVAALVAPVAARAAVVQLTAARAAVTSSSHPLVRVSTTEGGALTKTHQASMLLGISLRTLVKSNEMSARGHSTAATAGFERKLI